MMNLYDGSVCHSKASAERLFFATIPQGMETLIG
jgi:hypothetical protein